MAASESVSSDACRQRSATPVAQRQVRGECSATSIAQRQVDCGPSTGKPFSVAGSASDLNFLRVQHSDKAPCSLGPGTGKSVGWEGSYRMVNRSTQVSESKATFNRNPPHRTMVGSRSRFSSLRRKGHGSEVVASWGRVASRIAGVIHGAEAVSFDIHKCLYCDDEIGQKRRGIGNQRCAPSAHAGHVGRVIALRWRGELQTPMLFSCLFSCSYIQIACSQSAARRG